jgi:hypothetical protein
MLARALTTPVAATLVMAAALAALGRIPVGPGAARLIASVLVGVAAYAGAHALLAPADVREVGGALAAFRGQRARPPGALAAGEVGHPIRYDRPVMPLTLEVFPTDAEAYEAAAGLAAEHLAAAGGGGLRVALSAGAPGAPSWSRSPRAATSRGARRLVLGRRARRAAGRSAQQRPARARVASRRAASPPPASIRRRSSSATRRRSRRRTP